MGDNGINPWNEHENNFKKMKLAGLVQLLVAVGECNKCEYRLVQLPPWRCVTQFELPSTCCVLNVILWWQGLGDCDSWMQHKIHLSQRAHTFFDMGGCLEVVQIEVTFWILQKWLLGFWVYRLWEPVRSKNLKKSIYWWQQSSHMRTQYSAITKSDQLLTFALRSEKFLFHLHLHLHLQSPSTTYLLLLLLLVLLGFVLLFVWCKFIFIGISGVWAEHVLAPKNIVVKIQEMKGTAAMRGLLSLLSLSLLGSSSSLPSQQYLINGSARGLEFLGYGINPSAGTYRLQIGRASCRERV